MAIGYLTIQAKTAHDALPLGGILIRILDDRERSVYELITDENGETQTVPLETVDKSFSQNPYFSGPPYVSYNVLATAPGFNSLYVSQIPIYDGVRAVLPLHSSLCRCGSKAPSGGNLCGKPGRFPERPPLPGGKFKRYVSSAPGNHPQSHHRAFGAARLLRIQCTGILP